MKIAYVEDNPDDAAAYSRYLLKHQIVHFFKMHDFLASNDKFDLLISDLRLPDVYGKEALDLLKTVEMPVIILTGMGKPEFEIAKENIAAHGFEHVLTKDIKPQEFAKYVNDNFGEV